MIRVLIVAPYASVRAGLHAFLADADDCQVVGDIGGSAEWERVLPELRPDVALFDYSDGEGMRLPDALDVLANARVGLVMLGDSGTGYLMLAESELPGWAYLLKEAEGAEIVGAARAVAAGLVVLDRSLAPLLNQPLPPLSVDADEAPLSSEETLTARELQVLQLMAQGLPNKVIAARLAISLHTVKFHVASILAKLDVGSRTEAVTNGARRGFVTL